MNPPIASAMTSPAPEDAELVEAVTERIYEIDPRTQNTAEIIARAIVHIIRQHYERVASSESTAREIGVEIVDAAHGFTCEFNANPNQHRQLYALAEEKINELVAVERQHEREKIARELQEFDPPEEWMHPKEFARAFFRDHYGIEVKP